MCQTNAVDGVFEIIQSNPVVYFRQGPLLLIRTDRGQIITTVSHTIKWPMIDWSSCAHSSIRRTFEFFEASYPGVVNLLLQHTPDAAVDWFEVRRIEWPVLKE